MNQDVKQIGLLPAWKRESLLCVLTVTENMINFKVINVTCDCGSGAGDRCCLNKHSYIYYDMLCILLLFPFLYETLQCSMYWWKGSREPGTFIPPLPDSPGSP